MKNVLVLGAGPAGLLAAETAFKYGANVAVWSRAGSRNGVGNALKSDLFGCQYLHQPVLPGLGEGRLVRYELRGDSAGYRAKVYGENWEGRVSPDEYGPEQRHLAWDLRLAYDRLWSSWGSRALAGPDITAYTVEKALGSDVWDLIVSSIPAPALCRRWSDREAGEENPHNFLSQKIWAVGEAPNRPVRLLCDNETIVCNGLWDTGWYRMARVFEHTTVEYPWRDGKKPPLEGVVGVTKPLSTNCDCWSDVRFMRVGRYGKWQKGYLVHHVVDDVERAMVAL